MRISCTGFVSASTGSIAAANGILLRAMLQRGHEVVFFSKPSFVDPRPVLGDLPNFAFEPVVNALQDGLRSRVESWPGASIPARLWDAASYNAMLVRSIREAHLRAPFDRILWLGDHARGGVPGVPTVSFVQGAPGSDARSILRRFNDIRTINGLAFALRLAALARLRLSPIGLPHMDSSDALIVGSSVSRDLLTSQFGIPSGQIHTLPYPIDLEHFRPDFNAARPDAALRVLWLGRMVPRKRLDVFLDGARMAIERGVDVRLTVVGSDGGLGRESSQMEAFPFSDRLQRLGSVSRGDVPGLLRDHHVLAQPSDEEDFGSSVAEAQACGLPVIVGSTNGNADYLCSRDIHLADDRPDTFASALCTLATRKANGSLGHPSESRAFAERTFAPARIAARLDAILESVRCR